MVTQGKGRLDLAEVIDAEVTGALQGLRAAQRLLRPPTLALSLLPAKEVFVCLDNTAAINGLTGTASDTSQHLEFQDIASGWGLVKCEMVPWSFTITRQQNS